MLCDNVRLAEAPYYQLTSACSDTQRSELLEYISLNSFVNALACVNHSKTDGVSVAEFVIVLPFDVQLYGALVCLTNCIR